MAKYIEQDQSAMLAHYSRKDIQEQIIAASTDKEVVGSFGGRGYAKRPDVLVYPNDILELVKQGVTSFHASEELWNDPQQLRTGMSQKELGDLRKGWDLLLDIDCPVLEYSQVAADVVIQALTHFGIQNVSCKFSGNHGFHIGVPFESFPKTVNDKAVETLFPEGPKNIAVFLQDFIQDELAKQLLDFVKTQLHITDTSKIIEHIAEKIDKPFKELVDETFNPFVVVDIDTILITSRHLYRQIYSVNEKSGLISLPINPLKVRAFKKDIAAIKNCPISRFGFLERDKSKPDEAATLFIQAFDKATHEKQAADFAKEQKLAREFEPLTEKIPPHFFPPHIKAMFQPLSDGKKRALFVLSRFLRCCGYSSNEVVQMLTDWNKKHPEPLRDAYFEGQMRYFKQHTDVVLPYNYGHDVYKIVQIVEDELTKRVKNPVAYAKVKFESSKE